MTPVHTPLLMLFRPQTTQPPNDQPITAFGVGGELFSYLNAHENIRQRLNSTEKFPLEPTFKSFRRGSNEKFDGFRGLITKQRQLR